MNILLFGASGMVGDDVLRWLIASPKVSRVIAVSAQATPGAASQAASRLLKPPQ